MGDVTQTAATLLREAARCLSRDDMREAADAIDPPRPRTFRATHRVDTPGLPPLFCLREADALRCAEERGVTSSIFLHVRDRSGGREGWEFWRTAP